MTRKLIILILTIHNVVFSNQNDNRLKMYALYTPSHEILVKKYFQPSIKDNFNLQLQVFDQKCPSAEFNSLGWNSTMIDKVDVIINAIKENMEKIFIFSDVDIIFIRSTEPKIKELMSKYDFVIQKSSMINNLACTGFFAMRGNLGNLNLWTQIKEYMLKNPKLSEENVLNIFIKSNRLKNIKWSYLPIEFYNGGMLTNKRWNPGQEIKTPKDIILHHANWTVGINNKIAQFEYILNKTNTKIHE